MAEGHKCYHGKLLLLVERQFMLKANICDERVCSTETNATALTPEHSSPHCMAGWGVSGFNGQANGFEPSPWTLVPVRVSVAATPSTFGETWRGNSIR